MIANNAFEWTETTTITTISVSFGDKTVQVVLWFVRRPPNPNLRCLCG
jgi:hypothetical protein